MLLLLRLVELGLSLGLVVEPLCLVLHLLQLLHGGLGTGLGLASSTSSCVKCLSRRLLLLRETLTWLPLRCTTLLKGLLLGGGCLGELILVESICCVLLACLG